MANPNQSSGALSNLNIRIRQPSTSPPTVALSVTNDHTSPITLLRWNSPLDPLVLQLGILTVTPEGEDTPLHIDAIQLRRLMPPPDNDIVTLLPGESSEQEVILRETILPFDKLGKTPRVAVKGRWHAVWPTTRDQISQETIEKLGFGEGALTGEFESEAVAVALS
ncbi:putative secreted protein [Colletotrichum sidae]|uniref:Putative secreted protein n=1 Tax=Colletotrichum sidae TaxID=1347389 RepID=A0A4R8T9S8_9PEZI|nr:putative secreted protein [Colletotrichum sidae]